ncbi:MAG TPA: type II toxin-antitoxin system prevent-host-death family antitoxin [Herpetosiphonaceae bacterium]
MQAVTLDEAQAHLVDLVEAAISGETVVITKDGQQVQLVPVLQPIHRPKFGSARGQIQMADDFDAPLADFDEYMR